MLRPATIVAVACFIAFSTTAIAQENCYNCHGQKTSPGYVGKALYEQSVHGFLECTKCHTGVTSYPHKNPGEVKCISCHLLSSSGAPVEQAREFALSVHGRAGSGGPGCADCHGSHYIYPSSDPRSATYKSKVPSLCGQCHPAPLEEYGKSIHGVLFARLPESGAPGCFDCHLEHRVPPTGEDRWKRELIGKCGSCHARELNTYHKTYHGKVTALGYTTIAKCWDCHGSHGILPPEDPASRLSSRNIVSTCAECHPGASEGFARFYAHPDETDRENYPVLYYTYLFMTTLLIGVFAFFLTHTVLWSYRALKERIQKKGGM